MSLQPSLLLFKFENFVDLSSDDYNPRLYDTQWDCRGNSWQVQLYPEGISDTKEEGFVAIKLSIESFGDDDIDDFKIGVSVRDANGIAVVQKEFEETNCDFNLHYSKFIKRSRILDETNNILHDGALAIYLTIQYKVPSYKLYQPQSILAENMMKLLMDEDKADVSFDVRGKIFRAHSHILHANAPILSSFLNQREHNSAVAINDTHPDVFHHVLEYVYAEILPPTTVAIKLGQELIDAANRYGLVGMKLAVENVLVQECVIDNKNAAGYIVFADAMSCPLLKEYAISYFLLHAADILRSEHSRRLRESGELMAELWNLMANENVESMTVTELREELGKRGLDIDGSKRALVLRLEGAKRQKVE